MNDIQRDELLIELRQDVKWLKAWAVEHKATHAKYVYYFLITLTGLLVAFVT